MDSHITKKRIAIVGLGHIAEHRLKALEQTPSWELVATCDVKTERRALVNASVPFFSSVDELLEKSDVDLVVVATSTQSHYEVGRKVLERGKNLLLEKPCCETSEQISDLLSISQRTGAFFSVALHAMHALDVNWLLEHSNELKLDFADIDWFYAGFFDPYILNGLLLTAGDSLVNPWIDSGINALSVVGSFIDPSQLQVEDGRFTHLPVRSCPYPQATVSFRFSTGKHRGRGVIETNWALGINQKSTRLGFRDSSQSEVLLDHTNETVIVYKGGREESRVDLRNEHSRLTNHYVGVFKDAHRRLSEADPNAPLAETLHSLLFKAMTFADKKAAS